MAVSYRESLIELLGVLEREGGYRTPRDQVAIARARTLVATAVPNLQITAVVCNMLLCPSRLELAGDLEPTAAALEAERRRWWTDGEKHICPSCKEGA